MINSSTSSLTRTMIVNHGVANIGKTTTIKKIYDAISKAPNYRLTPLRPTLGGGMGGEGDVFALFTVVNLRGRRVTVGIESQGDPYSRLFRSLPAFVNDQCEVIITACRTRGQTANAVMQCADDNGYRLIWAQNPWFHESPKNLIERDSLQQYYVDSIVQMFDDIINGRF